MLKIKISGRGFPSTKILDGNGYSSISKFLPQGKNGWKNCQFFVNEDIVKPDFWFIIDNIEAKKEYAYIAKNRIFFGTDEVPYVTSYVDDTEFLAQFHKIFTPHPIFNHDNVEHVASFTPITMSSHYEGSLFAYDPVFNYDNLLGIKEFEKTKVISIVTSNKGSKHNKVTENHSFRYHFVHKLKEHFKDKIDLYGYGFNEIKNKADAVVPYKYHLCLDNQATPDVITEKIYCTYLGLAYPICWGAPNLEDYFPKEAFSYINIFDFKKSVQKIEQVLDEDPYQKSLPYLNQAKEKVLKEYGALQKIAKICEKEHELLNGHIRENITLESRDSLNRVESKKVKKLKKLFKYGAPSVITYELIRQLINL